MLIRSLGYRTDFWFHARQGEIVDRGDYLVVRTPDNPTYFWGNLLFFPAPPDAEAFERWPVLFRQEIGIAPVTTHQTFAWDGTDGACGDVAPFLAAGFEVERGTVLLAHQVQAPARLNHEITVRPLVTDADWLAATANQVACREADFDVERYQVFKSRQMAGYRDLTRLGFGQWWGAFLGDRLVADLGLFIQEGVGRFQSVGTHPNHRRQGVCGTLVYEAARRALDMGAAARLVMVADPDYHAARIYESLGFAATEQQMGMCWHDRQVWGD